MFHESVVKPTKHFLSAPFVFASSSKYDVDIRKLEDVKVGVPCFEDHVLDGIKPCDNKTSVQKTTDKMIIFCDIISD